MRSPRSARAFAPGHVTGLFRPDVRSRDPRGRGSVGAGLVLDLGAWAEARFTPGPRPRVRLAGRWPISLDVARRLAPDEPGTLEVRLTHELPVGQGFGMSAAGALATALSVAALSGRPRAQAVQVAHLADLFGGGGLGGVAAILGGGLEVRSRPGIPPFGRVHHLPIRSPILVGIVGRPIPSPAVLRDARAIARIVAAARGWRELADHPSLDRFFRLSERFTDRAGLAPPSVRRVVLALRARGSRAAQAMFGQSFFARPPDDRARARCLDWLEGHGIPAVELRPAARGARVDRHERP